MNYDNEVRELWKREGKDLLHQREGLHLSHTRLAKMMRISYSVIKRLEEGLHIKRRNVVVKSYKNALSLYYALIILVLKKTKFEHKELLI